jgi:hypothetical protein
MCAIHIWPLVVVITISTSPQKTSLKKIRFFQLLFEWLCSSNMQNLRTCTLVQWKGLQHLGGRTNGSYVLRFQFQEHTLSKEQAWYCRSTYHCLVLKFLGDEHLSCLGDESSDLPIGEVGLQQCLQSFRQPLTGNVMILFYITSDSKLLDANHLEDNREVRSAHPKDTHTYKQMFHFH